MLGSAGGRRVYTRTDCPVKTRLGTCPCLCLCVLYTGPEQAEMDRIMQTSSTVDRSCISYMAGWTGWLWLALLSQTNKTHKQTRLCRRPDRAPVSPNQNKQLIGERKPTNSACCSDSILDRLPVYFCTACRKESG